MSAKVVHADIKPNEDPRLATRYLDVPNMPWEPTKFPGIQIKVLYSDDELQITHQGDASAEQREQVRLAAELVKRILKS